METVFYLGTCSAKGFVSHYATLLEEIKNLYIIKGGAGCGKSTFMRAIGKAASARGYDVSYILCASDPDSLDAVIIPALSLCYVDGTAPHVLEPKLCGGSMNYINFGEFYDSNAMRPNEDEIYLVQQENAAKYPHVFSCLGAADRLYESIRLETSGHAYDEEMTAIAECLNLSNLQETGISPRESFRFLSAATPKGLQLCAQTPSALCQRVYVLKDNYMLAPRLLSHVRKRALDLGHHCITCHSHLLPGDQPSHLIIPSAELAVVSESDDLPYDGPCFCRIDLDSTLTPKVRKELTFYNKMISELLQQAVHHLQKAKQLHDRIELLCRPFEYFSRVDSLTIKTIETLFGK